MGAMLTALGIDLNFAPVVDLDYGRSGNALDQRYLGQSLAQVIDRAEAYVAGLRASGVEGCFKHFPGLGSTIPDSHYALPELGLDEAAWQREEGQVYRTLAQRGLNDVPLMLAHVRVPFWGDEIASLSARAVQAARALGHSGMLVTDDLEMKALPQEDLPELGLRALLAGLDLLIICHDADLIEAIADRLKASTALDRRHSERLGGFQARLAALRDQAPAGDLPAARLAWQSLVARPRSEEGLLPAHEFLS
jgi:beta-N-acetylhexosaminidase